jgi:hypothetical protein
MIVVKQERMGDEEGAEEEDEDEDEEEDEEGDDQAEGQEEDGGDRDGDQAGAIQDPLSRHLTPTQQETMDARAAYEQSLGVAGSVGKRGGKGGKWMRLRKPLRELAGKIMVELRRRDVVSCCAFCSRGN